jgi:hypothetical protein
MLLQKELFYPVPVWARPLRTPETRLLPSALFLLTLMAGLLVCKCGGQTVTNGAETAGTLLANTTNSYTFNATNGDSIVLRVGAPVINPRLILLGPDSAVLGVAGSGASGIHDAYLSVSATNTGTFTVQVSSIAAGGSDSYVLRLARIPGTFIVSQGDEGGTLTNGSSNPGINSLGDLDMWSFSANTGDAIVLRIGAPVFNPRIDLYGPDGKLLATGGSGASGAHDESVSVQATNSGTFTVLTSSFVNSGTGNYVLNLAKVPGAFFVSPGDDGGALVNGLLNSASNSLGDLDMWSFTANSGDSIVLRMGATTFNPSIRLYNPIGTLVGAVGSGASGYVDVDLAVQATNSGTFTVVASSFTTDGSGNYLLTLAKAPGAISISPGDQGGPLTNGWQHTGSLVGGDLDVWSFVANAGDSVVLRMGATNYNPWIRVYSPIGTLVGTAGNGVSGNVDIDLAIQATNTGMYTVVAASVTVNGTGNYLMTLAQAPGAIFVSPGDEGGPMTNGWQHTGSLSAGDLDVWSFAANAGDGVVLRMGATNYNPWIRVYSPAGTLVGTAGNGVVGNHDVDLSFQATNTGSFMVVAASITVNGSGSYLLNMAKSQGAIFTSPGDEGGVMTNGWQYNGNLNLGDLDVWSFAANSADTLILRMAATNYNPWIRLYGPGGALVGSAGSGVVGSHDVSLSLQATNTGSYTVIASSFGVGGTGNYLINLAHIPAAFSVAPGDEGGDLVSGISQNGVIDLGDMDLWQFLACRGEVITLSCQKLAGAAFTPRVRLYSRTGALLATAQNASLATINLLSTNSGFYTVLVDGANANDAGSYRLTGNGLSDALNLCPPIIVGTNLSLAGIGGKTNATFILYTATNLSTPLSLWSPILTNQFDAFGGFDYTNGFNRNESTRFFRLLQP